MEMGMSRSQVVAEHLPLLRRYRRALTGNQASGDAYVAAMLEALLQDGALLDERTARAPGCSGCSRRYGIRSRSTTAPTWRRRRCVGAPALQHHAIAAAAFLLLSLEGFSEEEVAFILATDVAATRKLADTAAAKWPPKSPPTC